MILLMFNSTRALKRSSPIELQYECLMNLRDEFALSTVLAVTDVRRSRLIILMMFGYMYMAEHALLSTIVPERVLGLSS